MKFNISYKAMLFLLCATTVACNKNGVQHEPDTDGKTPISLSIGGIDSSTPETKAVITDGTNHTMNPFDVNSKIFMIIKSEYKEFTGDYAYLNYGGSHNTKYTVTRGEVTANSNDVSFNTDAQKRYWDDAHARSSQLTIWAYAQKGQSTWNDCTFEEPNPESVADPLQKYIDYPCKTAQLPNPVWRDKEIYPAIRYWRASNQSDDSQNKTTVQCQDLLFSNNIVDYSSGSGSDWRLKFDPATRHFPSKTDEWTTGVKKTEMKFYHAMSKITIHIKKGSGFETGSFNFTGGGNVALSGFNKKGLFHIGDGQFEYIWKHKPGTITDEETEAKAFRIPSIYNWDTPATGDGMTLEALVIPNVHGNVAGLVDTHSRFEKDAKTLATDVMMEFIINDNKYLITSGQLYDALHGKEGATENTTGIIPLEGGKNYIFTFTVSKTKIDNITATVADWEDVVAEEQEPSNARISLKLEERTGSLSDDAVVDIYRAANVSSTIDDGYTSYAWETGYNGNVNKYKKVEGNWTLMSDWFWPNNKTFYHFRALMPSEMTVNTQVSPGDYISIASGKLSGVTSYKDVVWGAPMLDNANDDIKGDFKWTYSIEKGFDVTNPSLETGNHQIYKAIGPSEDPIKLVLFHMMSQLKFTITTTTGSDAVVLGDGTTDAKKTQIELLDIHTGGKLLLGNGLVSVTGESSPATELDKIWDASEKNICQFGVVPQSLSNVKLRITTPDGNQYIVDLKDVVASGTNITNNNIANPYTIIPEGQPNAGKYTIDRWYPGFKYNYTFKLKKTGIDNIQATIVDWENVDVDEGEVTIQ